ncbi:glycosyltransferase family 1 protein [Shinella sp.]|uniref:glycosyltransferase family 1 protein n=1 Tax=Shinella sp. TaxID=1870904 RepID=UPI0028ADABE9|nr:glycosyltransferase family 1 protein [Shinella sp.]
MTKRYLVFISEAARTCGVEEFSRLLAGRLGVRAQTHVLDYRIWRLFGALKNVDAAVLNFPVVAWKKKLLSPTLCALVARFMRRDVVVVLHEWLALDWKRRIVLAPALVLASRILFSAPEIAAEFAETRLSSFVTRRRGMVPIPPNLLPPSELRQTPHSEALREQRRNGRLILGQFGSIYPKKQSTAVLQVAAELIAQGHDVGIVFAGSFIKGMDNVEEQFFDLARKCGVADRLLVTGYIADESTLFAIFEQIDVFCYLFPEGLTSRRGSVLAAALFGKPVVVNAPASAKALDHHDLFRRLIETHAIRMVPTNADIPTVASAVLQAAEDKPNKLDLVAGLETVWRQIVLAVDAA